jgi:hypothetical protein
MKTYDVYVPLQLANGSKQAADYWSWLEQLLTERFGAYTTATAYHEGAWRAAPVRFQGKVRAYSVNGEETKARQFFKRLKQQVRKMGVDEILVVEKEAPGPQGEPAGERV